MEKDLVPPRCPTRCAVAPRPTEGLYTSAVDSAGHLDRSPFLQLHHSCWLRRFSAAGVGRLIDPASGLYRAVLKSGGADWKVAIERGGIPYSLNPKT